MVEEEDQIKVQRGDKLGIHYDEKTVNPVIAVEELKDSMCCGIETWMLSTFFEEELFEGADELNLGYVLPLGAFPDKKRLPAIRVYPGERKD